MSPQITHTCHGVRNAEVAPSESHVFRSLAQIEHRDVMLSLRAFGNPGPDVSLIQHLMSAVAALVHIDHFLIRDERSRSCIIARQITAENQR